MSESVTYPISNELENSLTADQLHTLREKISTMHLVHNKEGKPFFLDVWLYDPRPAHASKTTGYITLMTIAAVFGAFLAHFA